MDIPEKQLKFTLACRWISPQDQGGVSMHNGYLVRALKDYFSFQIISVINPINASFYHGLGVPFTQINSLIPSLYHRAAKTYWLKNGFRAWQDWKISLAMAKALEADPPDVVEFMDIHSEGYAFLKRNPKSSRQTRVIIRAHTPWGVLRPTYLPEEIKGVDGWWAIDRERFCFHACDTITTPSNDLKQQLIRIYDLPPDKITVLPNLLDTNHFKPLEHAVNPCFTFLHVGRFERAKGVITMTRAFIEVAMTCGQPIRLINVGQPRGTAYNECMALLKDAGLQEQVTFTGFVPYDDLPRYYAQADAVLVPAEIYESFSYTVAQAMACGKTVIASDAGGIPETIKYSQHGMLYPKGVVEKLQVCMEKAIIETGIDSDDESKLGVKQFDMGYWREKYVDFYQNHAYQCV